MFNLKYLLPDLSLAGLVKPIILLQTLCKLRNKHPHRLVCLLNKKACATQAFLMLFYKKTLILLNYFTFSVYRPHGGYFEYCRAFPR